VKRPRIRWLAPFSLAAALIGASAYPGSCGAAAAPELLVAAAADLAFAFREIGPAFERAHGAKVTLVLGSTGQLAQQIQHGAPFDVFFAANRVFVEDLRTKGAVLAESVEPYARGTIVLATQRGRAAPASLRDLARDDVKRIAIANPAHAPYGMAAREALERTGVWAKVQSKLVYGENIGQALQFLQTGNVDAAILALSVARRPDLDYVSIDAALYTPIVQAAAVTARSRHPDLARAFIRFVNGPQGRPAMKRFGFLLPGEF
jgi:molybdate transport system substrate-binding protein